MVLGFLFDCVMAQAPQSCLEIGSWMGRSASVICTALSCLGGSRHLLCVDSFGQSYDPAYVDREVIQIALNMGGEEAREVYTDFDKLKTVEDCFHLTIERHPFMNRFCKLMKADSLMLTGDALPEIEFAYIDGDHTYEGVRSDCRLVMSKLTEDSMVVFDDYSESFPGILKFVDELESSGTVERVGKEQHDIAFKVKSPTEVVRFLS